VRWVGWLGGFAADAVPFASMLASFLSPRCAALGGCVGGRDLGWAEARAADVYVGVREAARNDGPAQIPPPSGVTFLTTRAVPARYADLVLPGASGRSRSVDYSIG